jgi:hypothetical protein
VISDIDRRNFYLMMSVPDGQNYAEIMGFSPPSEDVREVEHADILSRWGVFLATDTYNEIVEGATWFAEYLEKSDKLVSPKDEIIAVLTVYGMALTNKLAEAEKVLIMLDSLLEDDDYE